MSLIERISALENDVAKLKHRLSWFEASQTTIYKNDANKQNEDSVQLFDKLVQEVNHAQTIPS